MCRRNEKIKKIVPRDNRDNRTDATHEMTYRQAGIRRTIQHTTAVRRHDRGSSPTRRGPEVAPVIIVGSGRAHGSARYRGAKSAKIPPLIVISAAASGRGDRAKVAKVTVISTRRRGSGCGSWRSRSAWRSSKRSQLVRLDGSRRVCHWLGGGGRRARVQCNLTMKFAS